MGFWNSLKNAGSSVASAAQQSINNAMAALDQQMTKEVATASMAIAAQVANADGSISEVELDAVHAVINDPDGLLASQDTDFLEAEFDRFANSMKSPMQRRKVTKIIQELADNSDEEKEAAFMAGVEVAAADGKIDDDERMVLRDIAGTIGISSSLIDA
jgi:tellurite resistance protein